MFGTQPWTFERTRPRSARRDPFEAEFFTGEGEAGDSHGRTDSLVREVLQNSLDASLRSGPVKVRFAFSRSDAALSSAKSLKYLGGLVEHLGALRNETVNHANAVPTMPFLTIEDFGTKGLTGDPALAVDPPAAESEQESFYWFWRNIGRSGKRGSALGRWGLGKTVFPSASKINSFFGFTIRATDKNRMLMGQAITKIHRMGAEEFEPEGFFNDSTANGAVQLPFTQPEVVDGFIADFQLTRCDETGLSIVVPYPLDLFESDDVIRSVIVHFFIPILKRDLIVEVVASDGTTTSIDSDTIRSVSEALSWKGSVSDKKHAPPPFDFAQWAIQQQKEMCIPALRPVGEANAPQWNEDLFPENLLDSLRNTFSAGQPVSVRIPIALEMKDGSRIKTYFDAFLESSSDAGKGEDYFVRDGMTISQISTLAGFRGTRGLVLVEHESLSALLGDAEGPAHTKWGENEARPNERYEKWVSRVRFVKNSLLKLAQFLQPPPEKLEVDLLREIFSVDDPRIGGRDKSRKPKKVKPGVEPDEPPEIPPLERNRPFEVIELSSPHGFRIRPGYEAKAPSARLKVRVAYDVPDGNPFSSGNYSRFDFVFDEGESTPIRISHSGVTFNSRSGNQFEVETAEGGFDVEVTGFDPHRDLIVEVKELKD